MNKYGYKLIPTGDYEYPFGGPPLDIKVYQFRIYCFVANSWQCIYISKESDIYGAAEWDAKTWIKKKIAKNNDGVIEYP